jgi:hypothetical protein
LNIHFTLISDDSTQSYELWLPCSNSRIDLVLGSNKGWEQYHRILCPQLKSITNNQQHNNPKSQTIQQQVTNVTMKLTTICIVESAVWIGDSMGNIFAFNAGDCSHLFSYALEPAQPSPLVALVYLEKIKRVAAGLENGRLFLLDSALIPSSYVSAEGSFVLTELGSGEQLFSVCALWKESEGYELDIGK